MFKKQKKQNHNGMTRYVLSIDETNAHNSLSYLKNASVEYTGSPPNGAIFRFLKKTSIRDKWNRMLVESRLTLS